MCYNQCVCFQNEIKHFLDTLIQTIFFVEMKINNFQGDLTDDSAKKEALVITEAPWMYSRGDVLNAVNLFSK